MSTFITCYFILCPLQARACATLEGALQMASKVPDELAVLCDYPWKQALQKGKTTSSAERGKVLKQPLSRKCWLSWLRRGQLAQRSISAALGEPEHFEFTLGKVCYASSIQRDPSISWSMCSEPPAGLWCSEDLPVTVLQR